MKNVRNKCEEQRDKKLCRESEKIKIVFGLST
jgi:hypothetical protein